MTNPSCMFVRRLTVLVTLALAGCSSGAEAPKAMEPAETAFLRENEAAMSSMMSGMEVKPTGDVDKDFALMMIPHHQGAIDMAQALLKYGKDEELKALSRTIIEKQAAEIMLMKRILGDVQSERPPTRKKEGGHDHHAM